MNLSKIMTRIGVSGMLLYLCLMIPITSASQNKEVAITTNSNAALETFMEGRQEFENVKLNNARMLFDQAIQEDPNFALAHLYRALASNTEIDFKNHLDQAYQLRNGVSQGEQLLIQSAYLNADDKPMESIATMEKLSKMYPGDKRVHQYFGIVLFNEEKTDQAVKEFTNASRLTQIMPRPIICSAMPIKIWRSTIKQKPHFLIMCACFLMKQIHMIRLQIYILKWGVMTMLFIIIKWP